MTKDNPNAPEPNVDPNDDEQKDAPVPGPEIENFFQRLPGNFRRPKPSPEAVAAAVEAVNRLSGGAPVRPSPPAGAVADSDETAKACPACGGSLPAAARFCVWCGVSTQSGAGDAASGQHHFHHHYHHYVSGPAESGTASGRPNAESEAAGPRGRVAAPSATGPTAAGASLSGTTSGTTSGTLGSVSGGRAEMAARKVVLDWAHACNIRHIDDLLELYAADATLMRPSLPPVRSLPAIREFLVSMLEAGLGDVEMESLRFEIMGDVAIDLGRCRMLVPVAMGKRREERGKYLVVLVRQPVGTWKILADSWSSDQIVGATPESAPRKGSEPVQPPRKGR